MYLQPISLFATHNFRFATYFASTQQILVSTQHIMVSAQRQKSIIPGTFGVAMARHGLILWENDATGSRKVFKCLPGLRDFITKIKMLHKVEKSEKSEFTVFFRIF